jgi:hypothetical protein
VTERKVLFNPVNVGWSEDRRLSQGAPAFGVLGLQQMALARASEQDFSRAGYFEPFGYGFSCFNALWTSHKYWG